MPSVLGLGCSSSPACPGSSATRTWAAEVQEAALALVLSVYCRNNSPSDTVVMHVHPRRLPLLLALCP